MGMRVQLRLAPPPVVIRRPIPRERLNEGELYSLRCIRHRFSIRPPCRVDAPAQFGEFRFGNPYLKWTNTCPIHGCLWFDITHSFVLSGLLSTRLACSRRFRGGAFAVVIRLRLRKKRPPNQGGPFWPRFQNTSVVGRKLKSGRFRPYAFVAGIASENNCRSCIQYRNSICS